MLESFGHLSYDMESGRVVLKIAQDLADYYRALIPPQYKTYRQGWAAHITVVRPEFDVPKKFDSLDASEKIEFIYSPNLESGRGFYWINAWSKRLESIREELGLINVSKYLLIPSGYNKTFHCTVARYDNLTNVGDAPEK
jgi:hypothetical protein